MESLVSHRLDAVSLEVAIYLIGINCGAVAPTLLVFTSSKLASSDIQEEPDRCKHGNATNGLG